MAAQSRPCRVAPDRVLRDGLHGVVVEQVARKLNSHPAWEDLIAGEHLNAQLERLAELRAALLN